MTNEDKAMIRVQTRTLVIPIPQPRDVWVVDPGITDGACLPDTIVETTAVAIQMRTEFVSWEGEGTCTPGMTPPRGLPQYDVQSNQIDKFAVMDRADESGYMAEEGMRVLLLGLGDYGRLTWESADNVYFTRSTAVAALGRLKLAHSVQHTDGPA